MQPTSQAAPPILASTLLAAAKTQGAHKCAPASSGSAWIDEAGLDGGFRYGEITSIAGPSGNGKTLITYHAVASHILAYKKGEVALIDTTGSFSPLLLRDVLAFRLEAWLQRDQYRHSGYMYDKDQSKHQEGQGKVLEQATSMLDRVKVMRVFDFAGVVEAIDEIGQMCEKSPLGANEPEDTAKENRIRTEICDSEDEIDGDDGPPRKPHMNLREAADETMGMIIIDSVTNVVSSMMSKSQVHGQALLVSFMRSFQHLVTRYKICAVLVNGVVGITSTKTSEYQKRAEEHASIFASTLGKPALGKTFTYLIDTSILLSAIPRTEKDAAVAFRNSPDSSFRKSLILEVVKDRCGGREGRWAAFEIVEGVKLVPCTG